MIKSAVRIHIKGLNQNKLISKIHDNDIELFDLVVLTHDEMQFSVKAKDYKKILAFPEIKNYKITELYKFGVKDYFTKLLFRCGILVGFAFFIFAAIYLSRYITKIEFSVDGDYDGITSKCIEVLDELGVKQGEIKPDITTREIEKYLQAKIQNASIVVVENYGGIYKISIKESEAKSEIENYNIVASDSGRIETVKNAEGIIKVDVGDFVKEGDVLIESGNIGDVYKEADGEVFARVYIESDAIGNLLGKRLERTGNTKVINNIGFKNKKITNSGDIDFIYYEMEQKTVFISDIIPISKIITTYYELDYFDEILEKDELIEQLKMEAYKKAKEKLCNLEEIDVKYFVYNEDDTYRVVCSIETYKNIAKRVDKWRSFLMMVDDLVVH